VEEARRLLFEARTGRERPGLDNKVLLEWNAMFCSALSEAAAATGRQDWGDAAVEIADALLSTLRRSSDGRWLRSWRQGRAEQPAFAADYASLVDAFTRVAELTGKARFMGLARETADGLLELFWDEREGDLFTTGRDAERLIVRAKDHFDGAVPSANSMAVLALARLGALSGEPRYLDAAAAIDRVAAPLMAEHPAAFAHGLLGAELLASGQIEIVVGNRTDLLSAVRQRFLPTAVVAWGERFPSPLWEGRAEDAGYLCREYACLAPATTVQELARQLDEVGGPARRVV
jgi:uncharacterized protein YyaL (SSP411 family)